MKAFLQSGLGIWAIIIVCAFSAGLLGTAVAKRDQLPCFEDTRP